MSDLLIGLIVLGACIIAAVLLYNWAQEKKLRTGITEEFIVPQKDVLVEDFYIDPEAYADKELGNNELGNKVAQKLNEPTQAPHLPKTAIVEPSEPLAAAQALAEQTVPSTQDLSFKQMTLPPELDAPAKATAEPANTQTQLPDEVHPQIDLTAFLYANKPIVGKKLYDTAKAIATEMAVPMMLHGIDSNQRWHSIQPNTTSETYKQVACSIQLANRAGPSSKHLIHKFQFAVENMGLDLGAHVEWQGAGDAAQRAITLDEFCLEVDQIVSIHLLATNTPIHGTKFRGLAEANGLALSQDGKFELMSGNGSNVPLFSLNNIDNQAFTLDILRSGVIKGATFQMEIPKVSSCDQMFMQMMLIAQKMATSLNAQLVDDNQRPVGNLQIEKIRAQLKVIHATMVARGIMPGSPSSMRLFS